MHTGDKKPMLHTCVKTTINIFDVAFCCVRVRLGNIQRCCSGKVTDAKNRQKKQ